MRLGLEGATGQMVMAEMNDANEQKLQCASCNYVLPTLLHICMDVRRVVEGKKGN